MNRYKEYKDSGIEWIGEIPSHWKIMPIKYCFNIVSGATPKTERKEFWDGEIIWITPADYKTEDHYIENGNRNITLQGLNSCGTEMVPKGSLIFSKRAPIGTVSIANTDLCTNQGCLSCVPKDEIESNFFYYLLTQPIKEFEILGSGATFLEISTTNFSNFDIPVPPLSEQKEIADYLDKKCGEINAAVSKIDKELELLDELKQSEISKAVTKGLNPKVSFKPTGIDWIGEIPIHWNVVKLSRVLKGIQDGTHATLNRVENGEVLLSAKNVFEDGIRIDENESQISKKDYEAIIGNGYPKKGDILLCCVGTIGRGFIYNFDYPLAFQRSVTFLRIKEEFYNEFILFSLRSLFSKIQFETFAKTSAQSGVYMGDLKKFLILLPPITEQKEIADYLDKKCGEIDSLKEKLKQKKEKLQELRQSLISEVVTGKRKVF